MLEITVISLILIVAAVIMLVFILFRNHDGRFLRLESLIETITKNQDKTEYSIRDEISKNREEGNLNAKQQREEANNSLRLFNDSILKNMSEIATLQKNQLDIFAAQLSNLTQSNEQKLEKMRATIEERIKLLQDDNNQKLEKMRATVDEKLHETLEKRLGESFKQVSDRLEQVHKGLGEMQSLAMGVGDLKRVLTNVKTRGTWGEVQLGSLLEQILTIEQYAKNVVTKNGTRETVEFAIKLPGHDENKDAVWLPIDAKFPLEDYQRLIEAQEKTNLEQVEQYSKQLEIRIEAEAKDISEKYLDPPNTTDFGILFLPVEGLYAEVIRRPGLVDRLQRKYRVSISGPSTLTALLNSLQMGFKTLAIEKRSSEVWVLLSAVKQEFVSFGSILDKTQKKLQEASNTIEDASKKSRTIERKLKNIQQIPSSPILNLPDSDDEDK